MLSNKEKVLKLLKGIETGDPDAASVVNEQKYVQHNPHTHEGSMGLAELFKQLSKTGPKVEMIRVFEDGDYVFAHMQYDFSSLKAAFEIFRFEDGYAVEHWDNIQTVTASGFNIWAGATKAEDIHLTESHREFVRTYVNEVLIDRQFQRLGEFINDDIFVQHHSAMGDNLGSIRKAMEDKGVIYTHLHRVFAEGNFVLAACEGKINERHCSIYDLYRVSEGRLVEHWDTIEDIPPESEWKNTNGKFNYPL
ncbi:nuclear transport factor 2 family protein [Pleionea sp. CnH1-48]|uniref:nuclear transport factor 2 family protein n=1 Tax=Pleionea sp. CnH1-48 TaxID=2954494 RepID=UPI002097B1D7|nr:nuclear transport factor 2 family protein [Pleionea sp. CnH1-48]MCO7225979.1 hypothetical protein [Pleionea sp. CnH1-48]